MHTNTIREGSIFERVLVGVDGTAPSFEACRQAALLANPAAAIEAVAVVHLADAVQTGPAAAGVADRLQREAEVATARAIEIIGDRAERRFVNGFAAPALRSEIASFGATVVVLGSHGHRRMTEIVLGGVATELLHTASCPVLLARRPTASTGFPSSVVVGVDGSEGGDAALAAAEHLAERFAASLRVIAATHDPAVDLATVRVRYPHVEEVAAPPVDALVDASAESDLLVVGSRGLFGLPALGSVSERVAHESRCSVLVVRGAAVA